MEIDYKIKFEAETCRTLALVSGTPAGTLILQTLLLGLKLSRWYVDLPVMVLSTVLFFHFLNLAYFKLGIVGKGR